MIEIKRFIHWTSILTVACSGAVAPYDGDADAPLEADVDELEASADVDRDGDVDQDLELEAGFQPPCRGILGWICPVGLVCMDRPDDGCDPWRGHRDCIGICMEGGPHE